MKRSLLAALAVLCGVVVLGPPAAGTAVDRVGWWWVVQPSGAGPTAVPPPWVPDGGMYVASNPAGTEAVAALFLSVDSARSTTLTLQLAYQQGTPELGACAAIGDWPAAHGGALSDAPPNECARSAVRGEVDAAAGVVRFDLRALTDRHGPLNLAIVPGLSPAGDPVAFQAAFDPPTAASVALAPKATAASAPSDSASTPRLGDASAPPAAFGSAFVPARTPVDIQAAEPGFSVLPDPLRAPVVAAPTRPAVVKLGGDNLRLVGLIGLVVVAGLVVWDSRRGRPDPRLLIDLPLMRAPR